MKDLTLLVWLTQLGLSVVVPLCGFVFLAIWLRNSLDLGNWILFVGIGVGLYCAVTGFLSALRTLSKISEEKKNEAPPVAFNDHR